MASRISHTAFTVSTSALLTPVIVAVGARLFLRIRVQKNFAADDALLIVGTCILVAAFATLHAEVIDRMYALNVYYSPTALAEIDLSNLDALLDSLYKHHVWSTVVLCLSWGAIFAAKFSLLFFFRKLIDRIHEMKIYWWIVTLLNVGILVYGTLVPYLTCPHFGRDFQVYFCVTGDGVPRLLTHSWTQMGLDFLGDLLILLIPLRIVWTIQVSWRVKCALISSLGLTIFMMAVTVIRISGLLYNGAIDSIWEMYWLLVAAQLGIFIAAASAFRAFFVSANRPSSHEQTPERFFRQSYLRRFKKGSYTEDSLGDEENDLPGLLHHQSVMMRPAINYELSAGVRSEHSIPGIGNPPSNNRPT